MIKIGLKHTSELTVTDAVTAIQMGSGDMPVLATPAMMALMPCLLSLMNCQKVARPLAVILNLHI